jgi:hypothetical protein
MSERHKHHPEGRSSFEREQSIARTNNKKQKYSLQRQKYRASHFVSKIEEPNIGKEVVVYPHIVNKAWPPQNRVNT